MDTTVVFIDKPANLKTRVNNWWKNLHLKAAVQHLGLLILLMGYTLVGGYVFRSLEYPAEMALMHRYNITSMREMFVQNIKEIVIQNGSNRPFIDMELHLREYEKELHQAFIAGVSISPEQQTIKWTLLKAVFFSSTVITTIGYGSIVPVTTEGRAFCIVFALVGIPLTMTVIADWGRLFASSVSTFIKQIPPLPARFNKTTALVRRTSSYALLAVCFLFIYLAIGASIFVIWEKDWTFFEGFYFCFITMTTIGFGDLVPNQPKYMLLCTLYILVGLALTSTIIELVRRQYAKSWRQLRALQGPLTEHFRRIADNAHGLDTLTFQQDFMKVLTVVSMPRKSIALRGSRRDKKDKKVEWENAMQAAIRDMLAKQANSGQNTVVQFVVYESSV